MPVLRQMVVEGVCSCVSEGGALHDQDVDCNLVNLYYALDSHKFEAWKKKPFVNNNFFNETDKLNPIAKSWLFGD